MAFILSVAQKYVEWPWFFEMTFAFDISESSLAFPIIHVLTNIK